MRLFSPFSRSLGLFSLLLILVNFSLFAQKNQESQTLLDSTLRMEKPKPKLSKPARAALLSAALPGLGQYYNGRGWAVKVPVIYGIGTTLGYLVLSTHSEYRRFREGYLALEDDNPNTQPSPLLGGRTSDQLLRSRDTFRRNRDFYIIMLLVLYALNVGEATTAAHLNDFDINDNISFKIEPYTDRLQGQALMGFSLQMPLFKGRYK